MKSTASAKTPEDQLKTLETPKNYFS
jgi:hypothetical protein